ncbi:peroxisomal oxidase [Guyanagaster necrorhizus]|uniref:Acyl-coenzyme A oxidase n=1 Tax=Guyanagaster necrorhizus TaxID=856835 RepID=A0A9P7VJU2_9AGAR|nr:peroxisomal oxidase [Guyanagaster necrorhizus MCA 3950]KAG7441254.1 peroxisomal oxidase [Guyanagaster necrorhizus MCA 3950]
MQNTVDMTNARESATIDVAAVRNFLTYDIDGLARWEQKQRIEKVLSSDPMFDKTNRPFITRTEAYSRGQRMTNRIYQLEQDLRWSKGDTVVAFSVLDDRLPSGLHSDAFEPVISGQGSPALLDKYAKLVVTRSILGCYLQTELGHGSNVAQLETTATFIPQTQEFEIHSPTLTSTKWWIGALGKTATHGVLQAKLILPGGKDMGPHLFFVPLRSLEDHKLLPGIIAGDIGPKALNGYVSVDNGYARFDRYRIPKENMLSKFAQVTEDGTYVKPPHSKLSYGGMMYIRSGMISHSGSAVARAITIAIRYATVRRQGERGPDGLEQQVITYPSVHGRLLPILSRAYVYVLLGRNMFKSFGTFSRQLASGNMSMLPEMHAITSGLKVLCTATIMDDIESARRSMGGHGYSAFAGVGKLYADYLPSVTFEGENFVLDKQVVRAALKASKDDTSSLSPFSRYLRLLHPGKEFPVPSWLDPTEVVLLLEWRAAVLVQDAAETDDDSDTSLTQRVSKAVAEAFVATQVLEMISTAQSSLRAEDALVLKGLFMLYLLSTVEGSLADFLTLNLIKGDQTKSLRKAISKICRELLPNAIGLTDAFGISDWELDSALGVYDGRVYEALWARVQTEPLNQTEVPEAYEESIKPILARGRQLAKL